MKNHITQKRLKEIYRYDPDSGRFYFLRSGKNRKLGGIAGGLSNGRRHIWCDKKLCLCSRMAWLYMTGENPDFEIDHADTNKSNDKWSNLRIATKSQNGCNKSITTENKSGYKGVSFCSQTNKWRATIKKNKKQVSLGRHATKEMAFQAYVNAAKLMHGEFSRVQ